jgi:hypothetical protein
MKKRNLKPTQTAPVERPQAGSTSRDPLAMFAAGGVGASGPDERRCAEDFVYCKKPSHLGGAGRGFMGGCARPFLRCLGGPNFNHDPRQDFLEILKK